MQVWKRRIAGLLSGVLLATSAFGGIAFAKEKDTVNKGGIEVPADLAEYIGNGREDAVRNRPQLRSAGDTVRITPGGMDNYRAWATNRFTVATPEGSFVGFCAEPNSGTPNGNYRATILDNDFIKWCLVKYTVDPQVFNLHPTVSYYASLHAIIGYIYVGQTTGLSAADIRNISNFVNGPIGTGIRDQINAGQVVTTNGTVNLSDYECYVALNKLQDIVWVQKAPKGQLSLKKVSAKPQCTDGNNAYDLSGAEYTVFSDAGCTQAVEKFTTNGNGDTNTVTLQAGTYYVKETKAPNSGYLINENVLPVTILSGQAKTVTLSGDMAEPVMDDPIGLFLQKAVTEMDKAGQPNGDVVDFSGAKFRLDWYPGLYDSEEAAKASGSPKMSAVWESNEKGFVRFVNEPVSGEWAFKDPKGKNTFPLGTVIVTEEEGIEGTLVRGKGHVIQFVDSGDHVNPKAVVKAPWNGTTDEATMAFENNSKKGGTRVVKADADTKRSEPQGDATLAGVKYAIYNRSKAPVRTFQNGQWVDTPVDAKVLTIETKYDPTTKEYAAETGAVKLPYGTYELIEESPSTGYGNANFRQTFSVREDGQMFSFADAPNWNENEVLRYGVVIGKADRETGSYVALGGATLEGAVFTVRNISKHSVVVDGKEVKPGDVVGTLATKLEDGKVVARSEANWLPYGRYEVTETASSKGYLFDNTSKSWKRTFSVGYDAGVDAFTGAEGTYADLTTLSEQVVENQVLRGDWHFQKKLLDNKKNDDIGARIPFVVTSKTTGESHVIVTDDNGTWGSVESYHSENTNANDPDSPISNGAIGKDEAGNYYVVDESKLDPAAGTWFTGLSSDKVVWAADGKSYQVGEKVVKVNDEMSSFPYDQYTVTELPVTNNKGYEMTSTQVTISKYGKNKLGNVDFDYGTIQNRTVPQPEIHTTLLYGESGKVVPAVEAVDLIDVVDYYNLKGDYTLEGELHRVDKDGKDLGVVAGGSSDFTADASGNGQATVTFTGVNTKDLGGDRLVAFETLTQNGKVVVEHKDPKDKNQTVDVPKIGTKLVGETGKVNHAKGTIKLTDTIAYEGLEAGKTYTAKGTLMTPEKDGKAVAVLNQDGTPVTAQATFVAEKSKGTVDVIFTFTNPGVAGKKVVAFEEVTEGDVTFAVHADIEDENQTVSFPKVGTKASVDGKKLVPEKDVDLVDTVSYEGLTPGKTYTLKAVLHVKDVVDGKVTDGGVYQEDGKDVTVEHTFTPEKASGTVDVKIPLNGKLALGKSLVVFEKLYDGKALIGSHEDIEDEGQTVVAPSLKTTLATKNGNQLADLGEAGDSVELTDTLSYTGLEAGKTYVASGTLHKRVMKDGKVTDGGKIPAESKEVSFTPEKADGTVSVTFTVKKDDLKDVDAVVAFEQIAEDKEVIVSHEDITDENQTVTFGQMGTKAISKKSETGSLELTEKEITVEDTVSYSGLTPGKTYTLTGTLHVAKSQAAEKAAVGVATELEKIVTSDAKAGEAAADLDGEDAPDKKVSTNPVQLKDAKTDAKTDVKADKTDKADEPAVKTEVKDTVVDGGIAKDKDGKDITATMTFTPEQASGSVVLPFTFTLPAEFTDGALVAFEEISADGKVLLVHADITDEDQTVRKVKLGTIATDAKGGKTVGVADAVEVIDTVKYEGLKPGTEYTLTGTLMVKEDGTVAKDKDGKDVVATTTFTPNSAGGEVKLSFIVDTTKLDGKSLVAFEQVTTSNKTLIGSHEDLNDEGQTVKVSKDVAAIPVTLATGVAPALLGALALAGGIGGLAYRKRKIDLQKRENGNE